MTPLLYTPASLLEKGQSISMNFIKFLFKRVYFVVDYGFWKLLGAPLKTLNERAYGWIYRTDIFPKEKYKAIKNETTNDYFYSFNLHKNNFVKQDEQNKGRLYFKILPLVRKIRYEFLNSEFVFNSKSQSKFALTCLGLCKKNNIKVKRLYLPMVTDAKIGKDFDATFYVSRGDGQIVSLRNFTFMDSAKYWSDMAHMSKEGAVIFTKKLLEEKVIEP